MQKSPWIMGLGLAGLATALLAAEDKEPGQTALEALDSNGDGVVSFVEFQDGDRNRLQEIDADRNGVLTIDEFLNARPGPRGHG